MFVRVIVNARRTIVVLNVAMCDGDLCVRLPAILLPWSSGICFLRWYVLFKIISKLPFVQCQCEGNRRTPRTAVLEYQRPFLCVDPL